MFKVNGGHNERKVSFSLIKQILLDNKDIFKSYLSYAVFSPHQHWLKKWVKNMCLVQLYLSNT